MKSFKIFLIIIFLIKVHFVFCQEEIKSINLPLVNVNNTELNMIIDSIFMSETKCSYYCDTLSLNLRIIINPDDSNMLSFDFETQSHIWSLTDITPLAYFYYEKHLCVIYFNIPDNIFSYTNTYKIFRLKSNSPTKNKNRCHNKLNLELIEDDTYSQWKYYFYNNKFQYFDHYTYCDN